MTILSVVKQRSCQQFSHEGETKHVEVAVQEDLQAALEPEEEAQEGREKYNESSEDEDNMGEGDGDQEQHERMLAEVRAAGRPAGARRARELQTESVPERALNVGPMTGMPGEKPSLQHVPGQARRPARLHSQARNYVPETLL